MTANPGFQSTVYLAQGFGVAGELIYDGPVRSNPWQLISTPQLNIVGATVYTLTSEGIAQAGGTGMFVGILANPKVYTAGLIQQGPTMTLPDDTIGELVTMGTMIVALTNQGQINDQLVYNTTSGALGSVPSVLSFTASFATNVMTVTIAPTAGSIGIGSVVTLPTGEPAVVESLGSGTGGTGTYNLNYTVGTIAAEVVTATGVAPSGSAYVPGNARVILRQGAAAAPYIAIVSLTAQ